MSAPPNFKPAGRVEAAYISRRPPPFLRQRHYSGRRADGVRYEKKVQAHLLELFPDTYLPNPWIHFQTAGQWRWCQPDGLLIDLPAGRLTCIEVKYAHTSAAWWQTRQLYQPVLRHCFPEQLWRHEVCEVVKWFDPAVVFPEPLSLAAEVDQPSAHFRVHICRL